MPVAGVRFAGAEAAAPAPGVLDALAAADRVVICPSNPIVSIGPILAVPGVREAVAARRDDVVAVSPIVAGAALKGPADRLLAELGHESSVVGVARLYAPLAATLVVDEADAGAGRRRSRPRACAASSPRRSCAARPRRPPWPAPCSRPDGRREPAGDHPRRGHARGPARRPSWPTSSRPRRSPSQDGDVVVVTQKIVSKAEGRLVAVDPDDPPAQAALVEAEAVRVLRRRGDLVITETSARLRLRQRRRRPVQRARRLRHPPARSTPTARPAASATACGPAPGVEVA